ncbi:MAG: hypothetical protein ACK4E0_03390 [Chitinophagaceae bacterium]
MTRLIKVGQKNDVAFEIEFVHDVDLTNGLHLQRQRCKARIWINGISLGGFKIRGEFQNFLLGLRRIADSWQQLCLGKLENATNEDIFDHFYLLGKRVFYLTPLESTQIMKTSMFRPFIGDQFDDQAIVVFKRENKLCFAWGKTTTNLEEVAKRLGPIQRPRNLQTQCVPFESFASTINELERIVT